MRMSPYRKPPSLRATPVVVEQTPTHALDAIIDAAALIAAADGSVTLEERRSLLAFLREREVLGRHGRSAVLQRFEAAVAALESHKLDDLCAAAERLERLAGTTSAMLAAAAAARVAAADGVVWPQEAALLSVVRSRLGVRPSAGA